ncbi:hypothetical protein BKA62DRAFT_777264 [Auriculariales sp. MPI-PUGE-AT-0066]|nr:hypothetical protein BKA62DRAFT_777264 [Auriculariales sp. MPI-PUGE-AT-0066]
MNYLITGAARGIGRGLTRILLQNGHRVFLLDSNAPELEYTASLAARWAVNATAYHAHLADLSSREAVKTAVAAASAFFDGSLNVLVNNAMPPALLGHTMYDLEDEGSALDEWDTKLAVGLTAPFLLTRLCFPLLSQAKGSVVNITSTRAHQAEPHHEAYSAVKAGLLGLTQALAVSLGKPQGPGIRVNALTLGWIDVDDERREVDVTLDADKRGSGVAWGRELREEDHTWHPAGRVGRVEDVASAVKFLAESEFVTGTELVVDGGVTRKLVYPE